MKIRRIVAYILVFVMIIGLLAGCKKTEKKSSSDKKSTKSTEFVEETEPKATQSGKPSQGNQPTQSANPGQVTEPKQDEPEPTNPPVEPDCEHIPELFERKATCTTEGKLRTSCELCGYILSEEVIPMTEHRTEWIPQKEATCKEGGISYEQCMDCKQIFIYIQTEPSTEHDPVYIPGSSEAKCSICGKVVDRANTVQPAD